MIGNVVCVSPNAFRNVACVWSCEHVNVCMYCRANMNVRRSLYGHANMYMCAGPLSMYGHANMYMCIGEHVHVYR